MIVVPPVYTPMHDEEATALSSANEESLRKIAQNLNHLANQLPLGAVVTVNVNQIGVIYPNGDVFQACNGTEIVNPKSPLRSRGLDIRRTPDLDARWPRCANANTGNDFGGQIEFDLRHAHGGGTSGMLQGIPIVGEEGDERHSMKDHGHGIREDLSVITLEHPPFMYAMPFMKIS